MGNEKKRNEDRQDLVLAPERSGGANTNGMGAGPPLGPPVADPEVPAGPRRRMYTADYKLRILREADACTRPGEIGALLRREGLYSSTLVRWREQRDQGVLDGLGSKRRGRKTASREIAVGEVRRLRRENERLQRKLRQAEIVIDIQKKVSELLGIPLDRPANEGKV